MTGKAVFLFLIAFVAGVVLVSVFAPAAQDEPEAALPPPNASQSQKLSGAQKYVAPADRPREMQAFDKVLIYLCEQQQPEGHWSARASGAAPEFCNINGDITLTALCCYALLASSARKEQNRDAVTHARKGIDWLMARQQESGLIADESAEGEPVVAQIFAALALLQSASMSTRENVRKAATAATKYAIVKMPAACGGFAPRPHA